MQQSESGEGASAAASAAPSVEIATSEHLQILESQRVSQEQVAEMPRTLQHPQVDLEDLHSGITTIANTAAHVQQINMGLDQLQAHLAEAYPMTDEERNAIHLPISLEYSDAENCTGDPTSADPSACTKDQTSSILEVGKGGTSTAPNRVPLADACAVLRGLAGRINSPTTISASENRPLASSCIGAPELGSARAGLENVLKDSCGGWEDKYGALKHSYFYADSPKETVGLEAGAASGAELRKATQILKRRLQRGVAK